MSDGDVTIVRRILLAPMEGLLDHHLRDILTRVGGVDRCVSEFIRVTGTLIPEHALRRCIPELDTGSRTRAGVPVRAQLLGSDPACLADNAANLARLGAEGVDLNFGCPARTVNRHRGGAALLDEPELIGSIVAAVRRAVPTDVPVSAKMRLGYRDESRMIECAQAIDAAGAGELVVHARTKAQGYEPPAHWDRLALIREAVGIPVVANGDLWTVADVRRCLAVSGCDAVMLGRGMVTDPGLALAIRDPGYGGLGWPALLPLVADFWERLGPEFPVRYRTGRFKQWLNLLRRRYPEAQAAWDLVREVDDPARVTGLLFNAVE